MEIVDITHNCSLIYELGNKDLEQKFLLSFWQYFTCAYKLI